MEKYKRLLKGYFCIITLLVLSSAYLEVIGAEEATCCDGYNERCLQGCGNRGLRVLPPIISTISSAIDIGFSIDALIHWGDDDPTRRNRDLLASGITSSVTFLARSAMIYSYAGISYEQLPNGRDGLRDFIIKHLGILSRNGFMFALTFSDLALSVIGEDQDFQKGTEIAALVCTGIFFPLSLYTMYDLWKKR